MSGYWISNPIPQIQTDKNGLKQNEFPLTPALSPLKRGEDKGEERSFRGVAKRFSLSNQ